MRPMVSFWDLTGPNRVSEQTSHDVMSDDSIKLLNSRGRISSLTNLQRSRSASLYTKISMSASRNASPSLRRLESVVDDDDGDEVNWSIEHGSTPIWRSARFGFSSPHRISKTAPKICVCRIPVRRGGRLSQANRKM